MKKRYYMRKFSLSVPLSDKYCWKGFINVCNDTEEELPTVETLHGEFWAEKLIEGWNGRFALDGREPNESSYRPDVLNGIENVVYTVGVYRPDLPPTKVYSTAQAEQVLHYLEPIQCDTVIRFGGRLEDYVYACSTHTWEYDVPDKAKNEERDR